MNLVEIQQLELQLQLMTESKHDEWNQELEQWRKTVQLAAAQLPPIEGDVGFAPPGRGGSGGTGSGSIGRGTSQQQMMVQAMQRQHEMMQQHQYMQQVRVCSHIHSSFWPLV